MTRRVLAAASVQPAARRARGRSASRHDQRRGPRQAMLRRTSMRPNRLERAAATTVAIARFAKRQDTPAAWRMLGTPPARAQRCAPPGEDPHVVRSRPLEQHDCARNATRRPRRRPSRRFPSPPGLCRSSVSRDRRSCIQRRHTQRIRLLRFNLHRHGAFASWRRRDPEAPTGDERPDPNRPRSPPAWAGSDSSAVSGSGRSIARNTISMRLLPPWCTPDSCLAISRAPRHRCVGESCLLAHVRVIAAVRTLRRGRIRASRLKSDAYAACALYLT